MWIVLWTLCSWVSKHLAGRRQPDDIYIGIGITDRRKDDLLKLHLARARFKNR